MNTCLYNSPIGILKIGEDDGKITNLCLCRKTGEVSPDADSRQSQTQRSNFFREACLQLDEYFRGERKQFDLPLKYAGTPFQESVWRELLNIPYGETRSYEDIAVGIGNPKAVRAVGQANNRNPILLMIPCHRVIHKSGDISGFACGIEAKKYLLELEGRIGCR